MRTAFDSDVLIYAATPGHPLGERVWECLDEVDEGRFGAMLLLPELLVKPTQLTSTGELQGLTACLARLSLVPLTSEVAALSVSLGANYRLKAPDAIHLASAVQVGAERFVTNNRKDFGKEIVELKVIYPDEL